MKQYFINEVKKAQTTGNIHTERPNKMKTCLNCGIKCFPTTCGSRTMVAVDHSVKDKWIAPDYCFMCLLG